MNPSDEAAVETVTEAFADCTREQFIRDSSHCSECAEADRYLTALDRSDVSLEDIAAPQGFDYFSMITDEGFRYFVPALCRIALDEHTAGLSHFLFRMRRASKVLIAPHHRAAIREFLDYLAAMRYITSDSERKELREIRRHFNEQPNA